MTPPPELRAQWIEEAADQFGHFHEYIADQAALWGNEQRGAVNEAELQKARDEELEACCTYLIEQGWFSAHQGLRAARRPKPKSQAEEAIAALDGIETCFFAGFGGDLKCGNIRAALEHLRELEQSHG